jgi:uncharacterized repeat protein (TIGR03803 family)
MEGLVEIPNSVRRAVMVNNAGQVSNQEIKVRTVTTARTLVMLLLLTVLGAPVAHAQYNVIFNFAGASGGAFPYDVSGLTFDHRGRLYGTTFYGGAGFGLVFQLTSSGSGWTFTPLYSFQSGSDGAYPFAGVTFGPDGALYGSTYEGGGGGCGNGCGTVYRLTPPATACKTAICPWNETVLYRFTGGTDGANPHGGVTFDQAGNLYGTTVFGGSGLGTVYQLTPAHGSWTESVLHNFGGGTDGTEPDGGVVFDNAGNLYSTATGGGQYGYGTFFQLTPSGSGWTENTLYNFSGGTDGGVPFAGPTIDSSGNLYGTTSQGGGAPGYGGTVYELSSSGGNWAFTVLYTFTGIDNGGLAPYAGLVIDSTGSLYGTTGAGGPYQGDGTVYELTPAGGGWTFTSLHGFTGGDNGLDPFGALALDADGNVYGTATYGGTHGYGVVFEITP